MVCHISPSLLPLLHTLPLPHLGGEKGVPLKLSLSTYSLRDGEEVCLEVDQCYCLLKVFKDKGADRKQKAEQQKVEKLPGSDPQVK